VIDLPPAVGRQRLIAPLFARALIAAAARWGVAVTAFVSCAGPRVEAGGKSLGGCCAVTAAVMRRLITCSSSGGMRCLITLDGVSSHLDLHPSGGLAPRDGKLLIQEPTGHGMQTLTITAASPASALGFHAALSDFRSVIVEKDDGRCDVEILLGRGRRPREIIDVLNTIELYVSR
jgi:hypothetical protein